MSIPYNAVQSSSSYELNYYSTRNDEIADVNPAESNSIWAAQFAPVCRALIFLYEIKYGNGSVSVICL